MKTQNEPLNRAIELFGSSRKLAQAIGVVPMTVSQWKKHGVPPKRAIDIEKVTGEKVTRHDLLPEHFGQAA